MNKTMLLALCSGLPLNPLPENNKRNSTIAHAAKRNVILNSTEKQVLLTYSFRNLILLLA